jgi:hypothetical protein
VVCAPIGRPEQAILVSAAMSCAQRNQQTRDEEVDMDGRSGAPGSTALCSILVKTLLAASAAEDALAVQAALSEAEQRLGLAVCVDAVLLPAMRWVGAEWQAGRYSIDAERLTTEAARAWLEQQAAPAPASESPLLLACGPRDLHSLALEALGVLLRQRGQGCRLLGQRTSARTLLTAVTANAPDGIVVVSQLSTGRVATLQAMRAVANRGPRLFYAGATFGTARSRRNVPGTYLGESVADACELILDELRVR